MRSIRGALAGAFSAAVVFGLAGPAFGHHDDGPRVLATQPAAGVTATEAELRAVVRTEDDDAHYRFQYGVMPDSGPLTPRQFLRQRNSARPVAAKVSGLTPGTTYYYRAVVSETDGDDPDYGPSGSFTTSFAPGSDSPSTPGAAPLTPFQLAPEGDPGPPAPQLGKSVGMVPRRGRVVVRRRGSKKYARLRAGDTLPVGSLVDASRGSLDLTSALPAGGTQTGRFAGGKFKVGQTRRGYVDLYLRGPACMRSREEARGSAEASRRRKSSRRRLFGRDRGGRFRTHGRNSHATVRGTRWVVEDTCRGTVTRVTEGSVVVRDFAKRKRVLVKAGRRYLARPRR